MKLSLPKVIGHRGAAEYAPENTLEGIHAAADMGVKWVELDVKLTSDDIPIIFHDDTLERTTGSGGKVAETKYADICQLEAGSWFGESFSGIKIPTLEEAIEVIIDRDLGLNLEIKPCPGREKVTAEAALDVLSHYWTDHDKLMISSYSHVSLETAADMAYDWVRALLIEDAKIDEKTIEMLKYLEASFVNINGRSNVTREDIETIIDAGFAIAAYTINDPELAKKLVLWGVDTIITDCPDIIMENL